MQLIEVIQGEYKLPVKRYPMCKQMCLDSELNPLSVLSDEITHAGFVERAIADEMSYCRPVNCSPDGLAVDNKQQLDRDGGQNASLRAHE